MGTLNTFKTDLYHLHGYVQNTLISHPKQAIIGALREFFAQDSYYHYVRDQWGFPKVEDQTNLTSNAGMEDDLTTRIYIGEQYRDGPIFYPSITVKHGGARSVPISMNRERDSVQYQAIKYIDGYGHEKEVNTPAYFINAGAWEGNIIVDITARAIRSRDELTELVSLQFVDYHHQQLQNAGIAIKSTNVGSPSESEDRNSKLFKCSVTFDIRTEWRRLTPVGNIIDMINFAVEFRNISDINTSQETAPNLKINTSIDLINAFQNL